MTVKERRNLPEPVEEGDDEFDDSSDEFSFYRFQGNATHTHITQRLRQPLLPHDDEGDALVRGRRGEEEGIFIFFQSSLTVFFPLIFQACLTVWWIILRFMEDLPEPRSPDTSSQASSPILHPLPHRQGRRLSSLVGLDQVTVLLLHAKSTKTVHALII